MEWLIEQAKLAPLGISIVSGAAVLVLWKAWAKEREKRERDRNIYVASINKATRAVDKLSNKIKGR